MHAANLRSVAAASSSPTSAPTSTPLAVHLVHHGLTPEAIIGIVCALTGFIVPLGIVLTKYAIKRHRGWSSLRTYRLAPD